MLIRMNVLNKETGEMDEVDVMGYFGDSAYTSTTHAECHKDGRWFAVPFTALSFSVNTVKDIISELKEVRDRQERLYDIINKVVNKGE